MLLRLRCPDAQCRHNRECPEAVRRRAEGGHACVIVTYPKVGVPDLIAAACSCGEYQSRPGTEADARGSWRLHADQTMGWTPGPRPPRPGAPLTPGLRPGDLARIPRKISPPAC